MNDPIYLEQLRRQHEIDAERIRGLRVQLVAAQLERDVLADTVLLLEKERDMFRELAQAVYNMAEGLQRCWDNKLSLEELKDLIGHAGDLLREAHDA